MLTEEFKDWIVDENQISEDTIAKHENVLAAHGNTLSSVSDWILFIQREQAKSLQNWLDLFSFYNLEPNKREWILSSIKKMADFSLHSYKFHRRNNHTIHPYPEINKGIMDYILDGDLNDSFKSVYEAELALLLQKKNVEGQWVTFSGTDNSKELSDSLQGFYTKWCITNEDVAYLHLLAGDIDVFYTTIEDEIIYPRLAIGRNKREINRIVGLEDNQGLEENLLGIAERKIEEIDLPITDNVALKLHK